MDAATHLCPEELAVLCWVASERESLRRAVANGLTWNALALSWLSSESVDAWAAAMVSEIDEFAGSRWIARSTLSAQNPSAKRTSW